LATFENKFKALKSQCPYMFLSSICPILPYMIISLSGLNETE
jgi:hypothetical protein